MGTARIIVATLCLFAAASSGAETTAVPGSTGAVPSPRTTVRAPLVDKIVINGEVDGGLAEFVKRALKQAEHDSCAAFLIEMNTYGGRIDAADEIRTAFLNTPLRTITYVNKNAASAGSLIAMATDTIVMSPGSAIGAATPVDMSEHPASAKVISYFRTLMGETARAKGRNPYIAEAMVDSNLIVKQIHDAPRPLTLRADQAVKLHIAQQMADSQEQVLEQNGLAGAHVRLISTNWSEDFVRFLTSPIISGLLMAIGGLGLIYEFTHPGFGLPGIAGVVCLALFFGSHWIVKLAEVQDIVIFLVGVGLIVAELFYPHGILGIIGIALVFTGLFLSLLGQIRFVTPEHITDALTSVGTAIVFTFVGAAIIMRSVASLPAFKRIRLSTRHQPGPATAPSAAGARTDLVGKTGVADSALRPAGRVLVEGRFYDAISEGDHIAAGTPIKIVAVDPLRNLTVKAI